MCNVDVRTLSLISELIVLEHKFVSTVVSSCASGSMLLVWRFVERHYVDARISTHCDMDLSSCSRLWIRHHSPLICFFQKFHDYVSGLGCLKTDSGYESLSSVRRQFLQLRVCSTVELHFGVGVVTDELAVHIWLSCGWLLDPSKHLKEKKKPDSPIISSVGAQFTTIFLLSVFIPADWGAPDTHTNILFIVHSLCNFLF